MKNERNNFQQGNNKRDYLTYSRKYILFTQQVINYNKSRNIPYAMNILMILDRQTTLVKWNWSGVISQHTQYSMLLGWVSEGRVEGVYRIVSIFTTLTLNSILFIINKILYNIATYPSKYRADGLSRVYTETNNSNYLIVWFCGPILDSSQLIFLVEPIISSSTN